MTTKTLMTYQECQQKREILERRFWNAMNKFHDKHSELGEYDVDYDDWYCEFMSWRDEAYPIVGVIGWNK